ncbi:MAG: AbrB/MazE/SpoVT family DNA-binding domain-containing protein [Desulfohalobiaceae bacterium]|nr:AbrB/MazE/SpoVT family DNA-binding domain-containing protein [Desulfohalobiaceae bacterium]
MSELRTKTVTVSAKGWVVIPAIFRKKIGLKPGMKIQVTESAGKIVLTPQAADPVDSLYGKLAGGPSLTEDLVKERTTEKAREKAKVCPR